MGSHDHHHTSACLHVPRGGSAECAGEWPYTCQTSGLVSYLGLYLCVYLSVCIYLCIYVCIYISVCICVCMCVFGHFHGSKKSMVFMLIIGVQ